MSEKIKFLFRFKKEIFKGIKRIYYYFEIKFLKYYLFDSKKTVNDKKNKIALLCPTKQRSLKFKRLSNSLIEKTNNPSRIEILIFFDLIENEIEKYEIEILNLINKGFIVKKYFMNLKSHASRNNF